jgi:molecular chaperone GrpE (heat shock protein)
MDEKDLGVANEKEQEETEVTPQEKIFQPVEEEKVETETEKMPMESDTTTLLQEIKEMIEKKIAYDETKEKMFNALHGQLKGYQGEFLDAFKRPLIKNLLVLYDDIIKVEEIAGIEKIKNGIGSLKAELLQILDNMEVVPFDEHSEVLDRKLQKTVKAVETTELTEDKKVVEVVKMGFLWKGNLFRPEEVVIKRYIGQQNQQKEERDV